MGNWVEKMGRPEDKKKSRIIADRMLDVKIEELERLIERQDMELLDLKGGINTWDTTQTTK